MAENALRNAAGSHSEPGDSAKSQDVSRFLQSLTDRQLQVMLGRMHQMFTRDEITTMNTDIEKIVTTLSEKVIIPTIYEVLNVDARSLFLTRPGSSNHSLESVIKEVLNAIVKTIIDALDDSHMCELRRNVTEKTELLASPCGSVELCNLSLSVEPSAENMTSKDQAQLQECAKDVILEVCTIYRAKEFKSASDLSCPPKMCATDLAEYLLSELVDMLTSSRSSSISDDISSDPGCGGSDSMADKSLKRAKSCHRIPSLMKLTNMACKMETSVPGQTLKNAFWYARIIVDELLVQLDSFTKSEVSEDAQSVLGQCTSDTSLISELLVDHLMAYIQEVSGSSFGDRIPATTLDCQVPSFRRSFSAKSFQKIQSQDTRTKAAQEVSKILLESSSFLVSSPRSRRAHTSQRHCSVEPTPSECLVKAFDLVDSVIDGICEHLDSTPDGLKETRSEALGWMESGVDVPEEILWYTACSTYNSAMRHLRDFSAMYQQKPPKVDPLEISVGGSVGKISHLERPSVMDEHEPPKSRERVSMASLLDTMMASLGLLSSGPFNSLEELSAAAERVEDLFLTTAPQKFANMVRLILTDRLSSLNMSASVLQHYPYLQRPFASEFFVEFADKAVKCLLRSCIAPRPASTTANDIPSLVMPFRVTPEISRPPSEMFADKMDLFSEVIVNSVMDKVSALSDHELDAVDSNVEETSGSDSHSSEELNTSPPTISVDALRCCVRAILQKVQEISSTGVHGSPLLIDEDQVQNVTDMVKGILALFTAVTVEDGEHALKKLHRSIIDAVYEELLQRMRSENQLIEAVKAQSELLAGSLAVSIVRAIKSADPKDLYRPASVESGSSPTIKEEPLVSSQTTDDVFVSSQVSSRGSLTSQTNDHAILATWLVLRTLAQSAATSSDLRKEASSNDPKELIERILSEFSASSSAAKLEEILTGTFLELLQRFGKEGSLHKALDLRDSAFDEALMTALRKHLDADASTAGPETKRPKNINLKKLKNIFHIKMPKLSIFKKKSRKDDNAGQSSDQDHLQSRRTADMSGSNSVPSKKEKPRRASICSRMFCWFRKISCLGPL
ncbi:uncharacterized protein LOC118801684 [Colossoma macropomum]|uniref:uncharacterized protein LOC118801684 n=1 Tax=Colossoma macropomum TaxID=42526 RepID=UPI001863ADF1|nr:uncharacterized protein LOC118801684 [Colossoma macropomum]